MRNARLLIVPALLTHLGGCAYFFPVYAGGYSWFDGWREGKVLAVGIQLPVRPTAFDCRDKIGPRPPEQLYAEVTYQRSPRRREFQIVPIRVDQGVKADDLVYLKAWDCEAELSRREGGHN